MNYKQIDEQFDKKYGVNKDDQLVTTTRYSLLNDLHLIYSQAKAEQREETIKNTLNIVHKVMNEAYMKNFPFSKITPEPILNMQIEINKRVFEESVKETINENDPLIYGDGKIREYGFNKCKCGCHDIKNYKGICPVHCCDDIAKEIRSKK